jgi:hypothetical protein
MTDTEVRAQLLEERDAWLADPGHNTTSGNG